MPSNSSLPLTLTNILLAVLVIGAIVYLASGPLREMLARARKRRAYEAELTHDMAEMFPSLSRTAVAAPPAPASLAQRVRSAIAAAWRKFVRHR